MPKLTIIRLGLAMRGYASTRSPSKTRPSRFRHLKGWQKIFGAFALILALVILLSPEFLAVGLLGDAAFFDLLVFALSLQLHVFATRAFHVCFRLLCGGVKWLGIPSPGLRYLLAI